MALRIGIRIDDCGARQKHGFVADIKLTYLLKLKQDARKQFFFLRTGARADEIDHRASCIENGKTEVETPRALLL